jgi:hypothetical protein
MIQKSSNFLEADLVQKQVVKVMMEGEQGVANYENILGTQQYHFTEMAKIPKRD